MTQPTPQKETTRHIVVHRRRTPYRQFKQFLTRLILILTASFLATSIIVDTLHPRTLTPLKVQKLAILLKNASNPSSALLENVSLPSRHARDQRTTAITGNPPTVISTHLLYWTPVESLTLVTYPASPPLIHHALPVNLHLHPLSQVSIRPLRAQSTHSIPRFTPFVIHPHHSAAILEHADGFLPARALQSALYSAAVTMQVTVLWDAFIQTSGLWFGYTGRCVAAINIPEPLGWARRISTVIRKRRLQKAKVTQGAA